MDISKLKILDERALNNIKLLADEDDPDFVDKLINIFLGRIPRLLQEISDAASEKDYSKLERSSHALKGSSGNIGATAMMTICAKLEELGREKRTEDAEYLVKSLSNVSNQTVDQLRKDWMQAG